VTDAEGLRRYYAELSDDALAEAYAQGEASYQAVAWSVLAAIVEARGLNAPTAAQRPAPPEDPEGEADLERLDAAYHPRPLEVVDNPVVRLWRGMAPLWFVYWVLGVGGGLAWRLVLSLGWPRSALPWLGIVCASYTFIVCMAMWSSAETYVGSFKWVTPLVKVQAALGIVASVGIGFQALAGPR